MVHAANYVDCLDCNHNHYRGQVHKKGFLAVAVLKIYTDGACSGNPGAGGWAALLMYGDKKREISGFVPDTTNNRMELLAAIQGLRAVKPQPNLQIQLYSDSAYIVNAINNGWLVSWQKNGWRTADKRDVKNQDLWQELIQLNAILHPTYIKVKGHFTDPYNNRCDELAVAEVRRKKGT
jgi:ribonuclease HI